MFCSLENKFIYYVHLFPGIMQTEVKQTDNCHESKVWSTVPLAVQSLLSYCSFHSFTCMTEGRHLHRCWHITLFMVEGRHLRRCWHLCISHAFSCDLITFSRFSLEPGFSLLSYLILLFVFLTNTYQTFILLQYTLDITIHNVKVIACLFQYCHSAWLLPMLPHMPLHEVIHSKR